MAEEIVIETLDLTHEYGDTVALQRVNLSVPHGAVVALVGPNGAGKTTLLKILAALLEPTRGSARVRGLDIRQSPREVHSAVGFLPDFYGLYDELTVGDYLEYFAKAYRLTGDRHPAIIQKVLEQVGLPDHQKKTIESLSRGMRQRVAIARTLIHDPPVLLLDEPAAGLDPEGRQQLQLLFRQLAGSGKTLIVSSHILTELEDYCTHVAILREGILVASGQAGEIQKSLSEGRRIRLRVASGSDSLEAILQEDARIKELKHEGESWLFSFAGGDEALAGLLKRLVEAGVLVTYFGEDRRTIQDAYLSLSERSRP